MRHILNKVIESIGLVKQEVVSAPQNLAKPTQLAKPFSPPRQINVRRAPTQLARTSFAANKIKLVKEPDSYQSKTSWQLSWCNTRLSREVYRTHGTSLSRQAKVARRRL